MHEAISDILPRTLGNFCGMAITSGFLGMMVGGGYAGTQIDSGALSITMGAIIGFVAGVISALMLLCSAIFVDKTCRNEANCDNESRANLVF